MKKHFGLVFRLFSDRQKPIDAFLENLLDAKNDATHCFRRRSVIRVKVGPGSEVVGVDVVVVVAVVVVVVAVVVVAVVVVGAVRYFTFFPIENKIL